MSQRCEIDFQGMTTMIIAPLTTIKQQIEDDCRLYGISALVGDQVKFVCSMIFCSSVNHETNSISYRLIKWSLQLDLTQIPINSLAGELQKRPQILIVSAEFLASIEVVPRIVQARETFQFKCKGSRCPAQRGSGF